MVMSEEGVFIPVVTSAEAEMSELLHFEENLVACYEAEYLLSVEDLEQQRLQNGHCSTKRDMLCSEECYQRHSNSTSDRCTTYTNSDKLHNHHQTCTHYVTYPAKATTLDYEAMDTDSTHTLASSPASELEHNSLTNGDTSLFQSGMTYRNSWTESSHLEGPQRKRKCLQQPEC